jgi:uncharacterized membrane protein
MPIAKIILVAFYLFTPWLILFLCHRFRFVNKIGSVVIAYAVGIVVGNIGILPAGSEIVQEWITNLTIPLAIPLLLFSTDIKAWLTIAGKTLLSMLLALLAVVIMVFVGYFIFKGKGMEELWKIGGMLVGVYSGGTPNLAALKMMLEVDANTYIITHTYDMLLSSIYLVFLLIAGQRFFSLFLPPFPLKHKDKNIINDWDGKDPFEGMLKKRAIKPLLGVFGLSIGIFGVSYLLSLLFDPSREMVVIILSITTLGIAFSFVPSINKINKSFELGMYLILIFSIDVASMADISKFAGSAPNLLNYVSLAVFGSLALHLLFSRLFKVDTDTMMVTSTALICSPPFVPVIAGAIKNREVVVSGLTVGIIGYAVGNYLGFLVAQVLNVL